jgi:hypothetical protein
MMHAIGWFGIHFWRVDVDTAQVLRIVIRAMTMIGQFSATSWIGASSRGHRCAPFSYCYIYFAAEAETV